MSFTFTMPAPEGGRFEPTAFVGQIGKRVPLRFDSFMGAAAMTGEIVAAVVSDDGLFAEITVEPTIALSIDCTRCRRPMSEHTGDDCPPPL